MRSTERKRKVQLAVLGIALVASVFFGTARSAQAQEAYSDTLACLFVLPTCTGCGPVELAPGACPEDPAGSAAAINVCLSTLGSTGPTDTPDAGDVIVNTGVIPPTVTVSADWGVGGVGGADVQTQDFPSTSPRGNLVVWIDPGVPVLGGFNFGIADQQAPAGCP